MRGNRYENFDPVQERRLNGIDEVRALYESIRGQVRLDYFQLLEPRVQLGTSMAVLTFNCVAGSPDEETSRWNCTEVHARRSGAWRIIQTHWSLPSPFPGSAPGWP